MTGAELSADVRAELEAMGEDPATVEAYLRSPLAGMRTKGEDRVREAEWRIRRSRMFAAVSERRA